MSEQYGRPTVAWRGLRERTTIDLIAGEGSTIPAPARTRELASRATLALLPAVLAWLRWRSLRRPRNRSWPFMKSCGLALAATVAFLSLLPVSISLERTFLAPGSGPLLALGLWVFQRSHADLGRHWSITLELREGHALVTTGIYARVRHPMYLGLLLYSLGQALVLPNWIAGPSYLVAMGLLFAFRLGPEERMLREAFGAEFDLYRARTKRLVPGVW